MAPAKSQRQRLQRQLEFYLSASNLRQDNLKALNATKRLVLEAADKSSLIRVDATQQRIAPVEQPFETDDDSDLRTIYVEGYDAAAHDHDSIRKLFAPFGKVALVSLPRFQGSRQFKGFGFVEFGTADAASAALEALGPAADGELRGVKGWRKTEWLEMKRRLKAELAAASSADATDSQTRTLAATTEAQSENEEGGGRVDGGPRPLP
ncbi:hypothetical protein PINS_up012610 [Pythium insidiosum]|nr:hypothetical protein PINS_up012610 [Pythium insidiosum]